MSVLTTGHDKLRVTVMFTARSNGYKCLSFVLLPLKLIDQKIDPKIDLKLKKNCFSHSQVKFRWTMH